MSADPFTGCRIFTGKMQYHSILSTSVCRSVQITLAVDGFSNRQREYPCLTQWRCITVTHNFTATTFNMNRTWYSHPPDGRLPLLSARTAVTFPATEHHRPLAGTKLYCLVTEAHRCQQLAQSCYAALPREGFEPTTYWSQVQCSTRCANTTPEYLAISQKRCKIGTQLLWNANRNSYVLYRMVLFLVTLSDPNYPKPPHVQHFVPPFISS